MRTLNLFFAMAVLLIGAHAQAQVAAAVGSTKDFHAGTKASVGSSTVGKHPTLSTQGLGTIAAEADAEEAVADEDVAP